MFTNIQDQVLIHPRAVRLGERWGWHNNKIVIFTSFPVHIAFNKHKNRLVRGVDTPTSLSIAITFKSELIAEETEYIRKNKTENFPYIIAGDMKTSRIQTLPVPLQTRRNGDRRFGDFVPEYKQEVSIRNKNLKLSPKKILHIYANARTLPSIQAKWKSDKTLAFLKRSF